VQAADPYQCPFDPQTGEPVPVQFVVQVSCQSSATTFQVVSVSEPTPCVYVVAANYAGACGA
jgi:hypothetical protein